MRDGVILTIVRSLTLIPLVTAGLEMLRERTIQLAVVENKEEEYEEENEGVLREC